MANKRFFCFYTLICCILISGSAFAQSQAEHITIGKVDGEAITYGELKANYRTNGTSSLSLEKLEEFLPVYLNYKAKLKAARDNGYYSNPQIHSEYQQYAKQAAYAYWLDKKIKSEVFDEFYNRSQHEYKAFHILVAAEENATEAELEQIRKKLEEARQKIQNGEDLEQLNLEYSSVRNNRSMGGILPWFSVGKTVRAFEDAVYSLEIGEVSEPVKTRFGYHLIVLLDKRERTNKRLVKHLFVREASDSSDIKRINNAYEMLESGGKWPEVVTKFSQDARSKRNSGLIGWVNYGGNVPEPIVDTIMELPEQLKYSKPVKTSYGYHIFRVDSTESYESEEDKKEAIMKNLEKTPYYQRNNTFVVSYLEDKRGAQVKKDVLQSFENLLAGQDSTLVSELTIPSTMAQKVLYIFNDKEYSLNDFHQYLVKSREERSVDRYQGDWFNDFTKYIVDSQIVDLTVAVFPEFKEQLRGYLDGLIIYQISDDSLWNTATVDSSILRKLYREQPDNYRYPKRPYYYLFRSFQDSTLAQVQAFVQSGNSPDSVRTHFSDVSVISDSTNTFNNEPYDKLHKMDAGSFSNLFDYKGRRAFFYLSSWLEARKMTFEEAFNKLSSDYLPLRETRWLNKLKDRYSVIAYPEQLKSAFNQDPSLNP